MTGILIPNDVEGLSQLRSKANCLLVIEKDCTFQKLIDERIDQFIGPCILITVGKTRRWPFVSSIVAIPTTLLSLTDTALLTDPLSSLPIRAEYATRTQLLTFNCFLFISISTTLFLFFVNILGF